MSDLAKTARALVSSINKKHGGNSLMDFSDPSSLVSADVEKVSSGLPSLDIVLGGGIPKGRIIEIFGPESSGKTTLATHMIITMQRDDPERYVAYLDLENSFDIEYAKGMGLNPDKFLFAQPDSGEEALDIVEKICQSETCSAVVIDSVANLVPRAAGDKEIDGTANIGTTARLLSQNLPRLNNAARASKTSLIFINQVRMKIGVMFGNPETTPGGLALKFNASIRLKVHGSKAEERNGKEGHPVSVRAIKNKVGKPKLSTKLFLIYGEGFDAVDDLLETAKELEIITRKGPYFEYDGVRTQGWRNFVDEIIKDEKKMQEIYNIIINSNI